MNRFISLVTLVLVFLLTSCGPDLVEENKLKRKELIAIHDEVMPLMGKLKSLEKKAVQKIEELSAQEPIDSLQIENLKAIAFDLNQSYEGMFIWMRQYKIDDGDKDPIEVKAYLEEEMVKITNVNTEIKSAIEKAGKSLED